MNDLRYAIRLLLKSPVRSGRDSDARTGYRRQQRDFQRGGRGDASAPSVPAAGPAGIAS